MNVPMLNTRRGFLPRRWLLCAAASGTLLVSVLSGCALSPYAVKASTSNSSSVLTEKCAKDATVPRAVEAADLLQKRYHQLADNERRTRTVLVGASIPLGAIAMYQGATGAGSTRSIAALGLGGAGSYLAAQTFTASPRELVYLAGVKGLNCVRRAYAPFEASGTAAFTQAMDAHAKALGELSAAIATGEARQTGDAEDLRLLDFARKVETTAKDTYTDALRVRNGIDQLGAQFCAAISDVAAQVAIEVRKTDPEPAAVLASVSLLPKLQTAITGRALPTSPAPTANNGTKDASDRKITSAIDSKGVLEKIATAATTTATLSARLAAMASPSTSIAKADACESPAAQVTLTVTPDVSTLSLTEGETFRFTVRSQVGMPTWQIDGGSVGALTAQMLIESGQTVLELTAAKPTGTTAANLTIRDGSGASSKAIAVTITAKEPAGNKKSEKSAHCAAHDGDSKILVADPAKVKLLQLKLGMPPNLQTGCFGDHTRAALKTYQQSKGLAQDGLLTDALWNSVTQ